MEKDFKTLFENLDKRCSLQDQIIQKQTKIIKNLELVNASLKEENVSLRNSLQTAQDLCDRQQKLLDATFSNPE